MSQKKITYKNNIYIRFANVSNIYLVFYGYAKGAKAQNPNITLKKIYLEFTELYTIDDELDHFHFQCAYNRIDKMMIELRKNL
jgi:hypothetical protein